MLLTFFLIASAAEAAVVHLGRARAARPGAHLVRSEATPASVAEIVADDIVQAQEAEVTHPPDPEVYRADANACTPSSICFDGFSCGVRYGDCYDANFCNGITTSLSIPTCSSTSTATTTAGAAEETGDTTTTTKKKKKHHPKLNPKTNPKTNKKTVFDKVSPGDIASERVESEEGHADVVVEAS